mmetsp:Transcript_23393/g.59194  ORF Transcript_23393/g.59194 Transcript_23393/m.59194 type:complete len:92 (+) Transcript_23393:965-1240(+)
MLRLDSAVLLLHAEGHYEFELFQVPLFPQLALSLLLLLPRSPASAFTHQITHKAAGKNLRSAENSVYNTLHRLPRDGLHVDGRGGKRCVFP